MRGILYQQAKSYEGPASSGKQQAEVLLGIGDFEESVGVPRDRNGAGRAISRYALSTPIQPPRKPHPMSRAYRPAQSRRS